MGIKIRMVLVAFALVCVIVSPVWADVLVDDLKGPLKTNIWTAYSMPGDATITPTAEGLEMTVPPIPYTRSWGAALGLDRCISGDFDARVDYELLDWPASNNTMGGIGCEGIGPCVIVRFSSPNYGDVNYSNNNYSIGYQAASDLAGTFRIARTGTSLIGYYLRPDGTWAQLNNGTVTTDDLDYIWVAYWSDYGTLGGTMRFSNFSITADSIALTCGAPELPMSVAIDIKPGSSENPINVKSKGVVPVAVLGSAEFNATTIDAPTVTFGPSGASDAHGAGHASDVNGDGHMDMVFHFYADLTGIACGDTSAALAGSTTGGIAFEGSDIIKTTGCK